MLIQKTLYLALGAEAAQARLSRFADYRGALADICKLARTGDGGLAVAFRLPCGWEAEVELEPVSAPTRGQALFRSRGGDVDVVGIAEFFPVRVDFTEVVLTLEYTFSPWGYRVVDTLFPQVEGFLNRQLAGVERHFSRGG